MTGDVIRLWVQARLDAAVRNQRRLAAWHAAQAALTRALDYAGAIISYCCVALVVFHSAVLSGCTSSTPREERRLYSDAELRVHVFSAYPGDLNKKGTCKSSKPLKPSLGGAAGGTEVRLTLCLCALQRRGRCRATLAARRRSGSPTPALLR